MRVDFLGVPVDALTLDQTVDRAVSSMQTGRLCQHVALNVAKFVTMRRDPELWRDVVYSDIVGIDGMGILWAARFLGISVSDRVAGIDLFESILKACERDGFRPYFLGARQEVLEKAIENIRTKMPNLIIAGWHHGYFPAEKESEVAASIAASRADCLFIAMPTPRKERLLAKFREAFHTPFIMGVGGSIDVFAGMVKRAPASVQALGLEWLYRTMQEPRRMFWRYFSTNFVFAGIIARAWIRKKFFQRAKV